ncbi:MAG: DNA-protecting protein DprA [Defluviitaleaceae bacterium]|nr:DNA-protecting protein DprA [Defluviitaleaceae bacterium]
MKVAIIGSRGLTVKNFDEYLPPETSEIVSGAAVGIDRCAAEYAKAKGLKLTEFLPDYAKFGRGAPLRRNIEILKYCDFCLAFHDGRSRGTAYVIKNCKKLNVPMKVVLLEESPK